MTRQTLDLVIPRSMWLTSNGRYHWRDRSNRTRTLRSLAHWEAQHQQLKPVDGLVRVIAFIRNRTTTRFDPANAQPTLKALIDGLTDAGIWPDDDSRHLIGPDPRAGEPDRTIPTGSHRILIVLETP